MRGITTFIVMAGLFSIALVIAVPTLDGIVPIAVDMAGPQYESQIRNIHAAVVEYGVVVFLFTILVWAVFWILRRERQEVRV